MSYFVCHVKKFKMSSVKGLQRHDQRETENLANRDIDRERSGLNYDLHNDKNINYNEKVKEIIDEQYMGKKAIRKDATVLVDTLVSSDKEFFQNLGEDETKRYFEESYNKICDMYGKENIVSAVVHMDETTPHMHLLSVPMTEDGRLSAKNVFDRKMLRNLQDELPKELQSKGFLIERGKESERKHTETFEYKLEQRKNAEKEVAKHIENAKSKLDELSKIDNLEGKNILGVVTLKKDQYDKLLNLSKEAIELKGEVNQLRSEVEIYKSEISSTQSRFRNVVSDINKTADRRVDYAFSDTKELRKQNEILKNNNQILKDQGQAMKQVLSKNNLLETAQKVYDKILESQREQQGMVRERDRGMSR